jgi:hypothetical protein
LRLGISGFRDLGLRVQRVLRVCTHAAHVGGEVEAVVAPLENFLAVLEQAQIRQDELVAEHLFL